MKNKVVIFLIGLLVGAILATGGFFIYENSKPTKEGMNWKDMKDQMPEDFKGTPSNMPDGDNNFDKNSRPSRQNGKNSNSSNESKENTSTPADKLTENNTQSNTSI